MADLDKTMARMMGRKALRDKMDAVAEMNVAAEKSGTTYPTPSELFKLLGGLGKPTPTSTTFKWATEELKPMPAPPRTRKVFKFKVTDLAFKDVLTLAEADGFDGTSLRQFLLPDGTPPIGLLKNEDVYRWECPTKRKRMNRVVLIEALVAPFPTLGHSPASDRAAMRAACAAMLMGKIQHAVANGFTPKGPVPAGMLGWKELLDRNTLEAGDSVRLAATSLVLTSDSIDGEKMSVMISVEASMAEKVFGVRFDDDEDEDGFVKLTDEQAQEVFAIADAAFEQSWNRLSDVEFEAQVSALDALASQLGMEGYGDVYREQRPVTTP